VYKRKKIISFYKPGMLAMIGMPLIIIFYEAIRLEEKKINSKCMEVNYPGQFKKEGHFNTYAEYAINPKIKPPGNYKNYILNGNKVDNMYSLLYAYNDIKLNKYNNNER
jgi:hypothetical protein